MTAAKQWAVAKCCINLIPSCLRRQINRMKLLQPTSLLWPTKLLLLSGLCMGGWEISWGFLGYYNPFTGEAQLNLTMPRFLIPYVTCHEMAHQLGYASESEASFVGYLAAAKSTDLVFQYSAYFDMFNYANHELFIRDSAAARDNYTHLDTLVKTDVGEVKAYWQKSDNMIEPVIRLFYDRYLKANQQIKGVKSYNEVVGWMIAYYKKYGKV